MWEQWIYKTIIAFLSITILKTLFKEQIVKAVKKYSKSEVNNGFIKATINTLLLSMIPFLRWVFMVFVLIAIFTGTMIDDE